MQVAAGKTGGGAANDEDPLGRRVFFGWNMPWSVCKFRPRRRFNLQNAQDTAPTLALRFVQNLALLFSQRQGAYPSEGPWRRLTKMAAVEAPAAISDPEPVWPVMEAFGSQVCHPLQFALRNVNLHGRMN